VRLRGRCVAQSVDSSEKQQAATSVEMWPPVQVISQDIQF
jgi:hypothetical protein